MVWLSKITSGLVVINPQFTDSICLFCCLILCCPCLLCPVVLEAIVLITAAIKNTSLLFAPSSNWPPLVLKAATSSQSVAQSWFRGLSCEAPSTCELIRGLDLGRLRSPVVPLASPLTELTAEKIITAQANYTWQQQIFKNTTVLWLYCKKWRLLHCALFSDSVVISTKWKFFDMPKRTLSAHLLLYVIRSNHDDRCSQWLSVSLNILLVFTWVSFVGGCSGFLHHHKICMLAQFSGQCTIRLPPTAPQGWVSGKNSFHFISTSMIVCDKLYITM